MRESVAVIRRVLATHRRPYVAYSGGKDSTVLAHQVLGEAPDTMVLLWDYGCHYIPRWLHEEFVANARRLGARELRVRTSEAYERLGRRAVNVLGREYLGKLVPELREEGFDLAFIGLRAEESVKRRLRTRGFTWREHGMDCCAPLRDWTAEDVWAYIASRNLPFASVYRRYVPVLGLKQARLVTFFDPEFDRFGAAELDSALMWRFKHGPGA